MFVRTNYSMATVYGVTWDGPKSSLSFQHLSTSVSQWHRSQHSNHACPRRPSSISFRPWRWSEGRHLQPPIPPMNLSFPDDLLKQTPVSSIHRQHDGSSPFTIISIHTSAWMPPWSAQIEGSDGSTCW